MIITQDHPIDDNGTLILRINYDSKRGEISGGLLHKGQHHFKDVLAKNLAGITRLNIGDAEIPLQKTPANETASSGMAYTFRHTLSSKENSRQIPIEINLDKQKFGSYEIDGGTGKISGGAIHQLLAFETRMLSGDHPERKVPFDRSAKTDFIPQTDLHTHLAGNLSPDKLIELALNKQGNPVTYSRDELIALGIDTAKYGDKDRIAVKELAENKHDLQLLKNAMAIPVDKQDTFAGMEKIYVYRGPITKDKELFKDILWAIAEDYHRTGVKYAELSHASIISDPDYSDPDLLKIAHEELPKIEKQFDVKLRFLAAMWRHSDVEWNQDEVDRIKSLALDPYVVGSDFMGHETNPTRDFIGEIKTLARWAIENDPDFVVRVHAGENSLFASANYSKAYPDYDFHNVKEALEAVLEVREQVAQEKGIPIEQVPMPRMRVGHGLYGVDEETFRLFKETGAVVEFNMSSNLALNNIDSIDEIPIKRYMEAGIPVVLGRDGQGIYRTTGEQEALLAQAAGLTPEDFQKMRKTEAELIASEQTRFDRVSKKFDQTLQDHKLTGLDTMQAMKEIYKPAYTGPGGGKRFTRELGEQKRAQQAAKEEQLTDRISHMNHYLTGILDRKEIKSKDKPTIHFSEQERVDTVMELIKAQSASEYGPAVAELIRRYDESPSEMIIEGIREVLDSPEGKIFRTANGQRVRVNNETIPDELRQPNGEPKAAIMITSASINSWTPLSQKDKKEIELAAQALANWIDPDKAYLMTGGTNHGGEKRVHEAAMRANKRGKNIQVRGTFTEEALAQKAGQVALIENDTFTDAIILRKSAGKNPHTGEEMFRILERWFDLQDGALDIVQATKGSVIAMGGGPVVRDIIQRTRNSSIDLHLMDGLELDPTVKNPYRASTEKATLGGGKYAFEGAAGLLKHLHASRPELFRGNFDVSKAEEYVEQARRQIEEDLPGQRMKQTTGNKLAPGKEAVRGAH